MLIWFCGLASPELHLERVRARVAAGGHDIPEAKILERYETSRLNLIVLLPKLHEVRGFDNSAPADANDIIPDPLPVLHTRAGKLLYHASHEALTLARTPTWAKPIVEAALRDFRPSKRK